MVFSHQQWPHVVLQCPIKWLYVGVSIFLSITCTLMNHPACETPGWQFIVYSCVEIWTQARWLRGEYAYLKAILPGQCIIGTYLFFSRTLLHEPVYGTESTLDRYKHRTCLRGQHRPERNVCYGIVSHKLTHSHRSTEAADCVLLKMP